MMYCKLFSIYLLIVIIFFVDYGVAYKMERIIGSYQAFQPNFRFQVAIIGKYHNTNTPNLLCSASILSDYFLLSTARCFMAGHNKLKKQMFFAIVGRASITAYPENLKRIEKVYTYSYGNLNPGYDISILKLRRSLEIESNPHLSILTMPKYEERFYNRSGTVAGYGLTSLGEGDSLDTRERIRLNLLDEQKLQYAFVRVTNESECRAMYSTINLHTSMCGIIESDFVYRHRGICVGDTGSPLIIDDKVVGIASKHNMNCNDTVTGAIYTKVSYFRRFIDSILFDNPLKETMVHIVHPITPMIVN